MAKQQKPSRRGRGRAVTVEEQKAGSRKCVAKAIQLAAVIDELQGKVPMHGWVDDELDDLVRLLEVDPFSGVHRPPAEAVLPPHYGFTSLTLETYFSTAVEWWAKAQRTQQQRDKYLRKKMYANPALYDHFMDRRNNLGSHFPNTEQGKVPGGRWTIARGYFPSGPDALPALKHLLADSMSLLVSRENKDETRRKILGAFRLNPGTGIQIPTLSTSTDYSFVVEHPVRLWYDITPLMNGKWTAEAWEVDERDRYIPGGRHCGVSSERVWDSPEDAMWGLQASIGQQTNKPELL